MNNLAVSLVRTWVPILVGSLVSWCASLGFQVGTETRRSLMVWMTGLLIGAYYTAVRWLERRYPKLGFLLGSRQQPTYPVVAGQVIPLPSPVPPPQDPPKTLL